MYNNILLNFLYSVNRFDLILQIFRNLYALPQPLQIWTALFLANVPMMAENGAFAVF